MSVTRHPLAAETRHLRQVPIDQTAITRLADSLRQLTGPGMDLAGMFYMTLFERHPALRPMFPADMTAQKKKLLDVLVMVIENLRSPQVVRERLQQLGAAHVTYGTKPEHYPLVCACIVESMAKISGAVPHATWGEDLQTEWRTALDLVSEIMLSGARDMPEPRSLEA